MSSSILIDWEKKVSKEGDKCISWTIGTTKYEIFASELKEFDISFFLPHCIEIRNKIAAAVEKESHRAQSFFNVFPRTLSTVLQTVWNPIVEPLPVHPDERDFNDSLRAFIAVHVTAEHRHDLLTQLRSASKPREMPVQTFYYRIRELNTYIIWMPGSESPLNEEQIKQAFYDAMPVTWRERYINAGKSIHVDDIAQIVRYFYQQETLARQKQAQNERQMRTLSFEQRKSRAQSSRSLRTQSGRKRYDHGSTNEKGNKTEYKKKKINADSNCPIHSGLHKWGVCYENARNINSPFNKDKKNETATKSKKSAQHHVEVDNKKADDDSDTMDFESSLNLNGMFLPDVPYDNTTNVYTHNFAISPFLDIQIEDTDRSVAFSNYITDLFVIGDEDETELSKNIYSEDNYRAVFDSLKPIGLLKADTIQNKLIHRPFKVLFDTGSEKTFINIKCLPKGVVPNIDRTIDIHTLTGDKRTNLSVVLKGITLPEFSPTKKSIEAY